MFDEVPILPSRDESKEDTVDQEIAESFVGQHTPPTQARLTFWGNVAYQYPDPSKEPVSVEIRHSTCADSEEQAYVRHLKAGPFWTRVETGWVDDPMFLVIKNSEPRGSGKLLMIGFRVDGTNDRVDLYLSPDNAMAIEPVHQWIYVKAVDPVKYTVTAVPK